MPARRTPLYIGTSRHVAALDPHTGEELWRTKLPHGGGSVVTLVIKGQHLFVGHAGQAFVYIAAKITHSARCAKVYLSGSHRFVEHLLIASQRLQSFAFP